ncbi:flavodoxin family protein, partial [Candidatus Acetothermia bacterium]
MCEIYPKLLAADALILATPVFFNNVTSTLKAFMDRTWCLRGKLRNKIGGAIAVGRRYGIEAALEAINA